MSDCERNMHVVINRSLLTGTGEKPCKRHQSTSPRISSKIRIKTSRGSAGRSEMKSMNVGPLSAPENTVEWLNEILERTGFFDCVVAKKRSLHLTDEIRRLRDETAEHRKGRSKA